MKTPKREDSDAPGFFDIFLAVEHPFLAALGTLGEGPKKAFEELGPIYLIMLLIVIIIFAVIGTSGS